MTEPWTPRARFFSRPELLRAWFEKNHAGASELWIGYYKKGTGKRGVSYSEAVEQALCYGWIDGRVRSLDALRYANRYTPRSPGGRWSRVNVAKVKELARLGRMRPSGLRAFKERPASQRRGYSFEERPRRFGGSLLRRFRATKAAWTFYQAQPQYYRRATTFWVMSAVRPETRRSRLRVLMIESTRGRRIGLLAPRSRKRRE